MSIESSLSKIITRLNQDAARIPELRIKLGFEAKKETEKTEDDS